MWLYIKDTVPGTWNAFPAGATDRLGRGNGLKAKRI